MAVGRVGTAVAGVLVSLALSGLLWGVTGSPVFFLFVPFVPILFGGNAADAADTARDANSRACPACGFETRRPAFEYCPRDGRRLQQRRGETG